MADWNNPNPINTNPGGDTKYQGFVKAQANFDDIYNKLNILKKLQTGVNPPDNPAVGELWFDENTGVIKRFDGSGWVEVVAKQDLSNIDDALILEKVKNVDGVGSGLDADLIRGLTVEQTMNRVFFVDAINGDDNNSGAQDSPFKTLKKAIDSIPVGGSGIIEIIANTDITIQETDIEVYNKLITFRKIGTGNITIQKVSETYDFVLVKSVLAFSNINFAGKPKNQSLTYDYNWVANFILRASTIAIYTANIAIDNGSFITGVDNYGYAGVFLYRCAITTTSDTVAVFKLNADVGAYVFKAGSTIDDSSKHISGLIKDSNGVPRNISSNLTL